MQLMSRRQCGAFSMIYVARVDRGRPQRNCGSFFRQVRTNSTLQSIPSKMLFGAEEEPKENRQFSRLLITGAILNCVLQLFWFGSKCINQIDFDGMTYAGIARHLRQDEFHSSLNAFRSPLVSW